MFITFLNCLYFFHESGYKYEVIINEVLSGWNERIKIKVGVTVRKYGLYEVRGLEKLDFNLLLLMV